MSCHISNLKFDSNTPDKLKELKYGTEWPVVYIINNKNEAYVGETVNAAVRTNQHLANEVRKSLTDLHIISDDTFNKSVILDLESFLIKYMSADNKFKLQNGNNGMINHNYYNKTKYENEFTNIWDKLKVIGLASKEIKDIENSDLFKYSPYKSLSNDQYIITNKVLESLLDDISLGNKSTIIINGEPGTGKTVLGIYLMKLLAEVDESIKYEDNELDDKVFFIQSLKKLKIGLVIPMVSLRKTLKKVFKEIKGLNSHMVLSPNEASKGEFDLLIVDEAHRLRRRKNLSSYGYFDENNKRLGLGNDATELDWILSASKHQILFYDPNQSIRPTDVRNNEFDKLKFGRSFYMYELQSQLRCKGGKDYINYIKEIFSNNPPTEKLSFYNYDLKFFDDIEKMVNAIKELDATEGLCRVVAGYAWPWKTKGKAYNQLNESDYDIDIEGKKYIWNTTNEDWVNSKNSLNEIGCIHTIQGYDLNYAGVIIGKELTYNFEKQRFEVIRANYYDNMGKAERVELQSYIINIYTTMLTRGIKGTFVYACDDNLRRYLRQYI